MMMVVMMVMEMVMVMIMKTSEIVVVTLPEMKGRWIGNRSLGLLWNFYIYIFFFFTFLCSGIQKGYRVSKFSLFCVFHCSCLLEQRTCGEAPWPWQTMELQLLLWKWWKEVMFVSIFANISTEINERRRKSNSLKHQVSFENLLLRLWGSCPEIRMKTWLYVLWDLSNVLLAWWAFTFFHAVGRFSWNHLI